VTAPWQMTRAQAAAYADRASTEAETFANRQVDVVAEAKAVSDLENRLQLERDHLEQLQLQFHRDGDAGSQVAVKKQQQKIRRLEYELNARWLAQRDTKERHNTAWVQYLKARYPSLVRTVGGHEFGNFHLYLNEWEKSVRNAYLAGEPVPAEVLADFPGLKGGAQ